jgi:hypothetical protein
MGQAIIGPIVKAVTDPTTGAVSLVVPGMVSHSMNSLALDAAKPFFTCLDSASNREICGVDAIDNITFWKSGLYLYQSSNFGETLTANKGFPTNVTTGSTLKKIVRFKGNLYCIAQDSSDSLYKIWKAAPATGDTAFNWGSPVHTLKTGATAYPTALNCDGSYIYCAEYGDPVPDASIYRSVDGTTWETVHTRPDADRHFHSVTPDPFAPGHVYAACGDGVANPIIRSVDYGATWETVVASNQWQGVQISFTETHVYLGADNSSGTLYVIDKSDLSIKHGAKNYHANISVPGGNALDSFYRNAFFGAVDPDTGIYYCISMDTSVSGNRYGLFYLPRLGDRFELLELFTTGVSGEMFIYGGYLLSHMKRRPLLSVAAI